MTKGAQTEAKRHGKNQPAAANASAPNRGTVTGKKGRPVPAPKPAVPHLVSLPTEAGRKAAQDQVSWRSAEEIGRTELGPRPIPALDGGARFEEPALATRTLDTGLTVFAVRKAGTPMIELRLRVPFAGRSRQHSARAEMLAATILLGTSSRTRDQVDAELALVGGHLDASVDPQRLLIAGSVLSHGLAELLAVLSDSLTDPAFARKDVQGERERLVEHLAISAAQPASVARRHLQEVRFGDSPAAWEIPDAELVSAVTPANLTALHSKATVPDGSFLVLVGDLDPNRTLDEVAAALSNWTAPGTAQRLLTPPPVVGGPVQVFARAGAVQSQVRLSAAGLTRDEPDYAAFQLANLVYGGYFSSRLVENIREDKGFVYGAHSTLEFWPGRAAVTVAFDTATPSTAPALWETRYELGKIALSPPAASEIEAARNYALGTLATSLATQAGYASTLSALLGQGIGVEWLNGHPARLQSVTVDAVAEVAARLLAPSAFTGIVVGDVEAIGASLAVVGGVNLP